MTMSVVHGVSADKPWGTLEKLLAADSCSSICVLCSVPAQPASVLFNKDSSAQRQEGKVRLLAPRLGAAQPGCSGKKWMYRLHMNPSGICPFLRVKVLIPGSSG